jgi:hypothetical protein
LFRIVEDGSTAQSILGFRVEPIHEAIDGKGYSTASASCAAFVSRATKGKTSSAIGQADNAERCGFYDAAGGS